MFGAVNMTKILCCRCHKALSKLLILLFLNGRVIRTLFSIFTFLYTACGASTLDHIRYLLQLAVVDSELRKC